MYHGALCVYVCVAWPLLYSFLLPAWMRALSKTVFILPPKKVKRCAPPSRQLLLLLLQQNHWPWISAASHTASGVFNKHCLSTSSPCSSSHRLSYVVHCACSDLSSSPPALPGATTETVKHLFWQKGCVLIVALIVCYAWWHCLSSIDLQRQVSVHVFIAWDWLIHFSCSPNVNSLWLSRLHCSKHCPPAFFHTDYLLSCVQFHWIQLTSCQSQHLDLSALVDNRIEFYPINRSIDFEINSLSFKSSFKIVLNLLVHTFFSLFVFIFCSADWSRNACFQHFPMSADIPFTRFTLFLRTHWLFESFF